MNPFDYIKKPCREDWNSMTGDEKRKFCNKCTTHVHDLTDLSHDEILALKAQNGGKLCGTFRMPSLSRQIAIGTGIASLALASCDKKETSQRQDPKKAEVEVPVPVRPLIPIEHPVMGIVCPGPPKDKKVPKPPNNNQAPHPPKNVEPKVTGEVHIDRVKGDIVIREPEPAPVLEKILGKVSE
jgi:hypothetical protein